MSDIVERLRAEADQQDGDYDAAISSDTVREAADEIERLRAQIPDRDALEALN